jgi:hypothetical protein
MFLSPTHPSLSISLPAFFPKGKKDEEPPEEDKK